jgi:hypothetical protein
MSEKDMMQFEMDKNAEGVPKGSPKKAPTTPNGKTPSKHDKKGYTSSATKSTGAKGQPAHHGVPDVEVGG